MLGANRVKWHNLSAKLEFFNSFLFFIFHLKFFYTLFILCSISLLSIYKHKLKKKILEKATSSNPNSHIIINSFKFQSKLIFGSKSIIINPSKKSHFWIPSKPFILIIFNPFQHKFSHLMSCVFSSLTHKNNSNNYIIFNKKWK